MRRFSILFLAPAAILSLALMPDDMALLPVFMLSLARAIALVVGFVCLVATGRLDRWSSSKIWLVLLVTIGTLVVTFVCVSWQIMREDLLPPPYSVTYIVLARAMPLCLMASAFVPSKKLFLSCVALTLVVGIVFAVTEDRLSVAYGQQKIAARNAEYAEAEAAKQARLTQRLAALAAVPADAGPEPLLAFLDDNEPEDVQTQAIARLDAVPNVTEKLASLLDGNRRLDALVALNLGSTSKFLVSDAIRQRTWIVAGLIARDMTPGMGEVKVLSPELVKLCRSLGFLSTQRAAALEVRREHRAELVALRDWLRIIQWKVSLWCGGGPSMVDSILAAP